ncbi:MAG: SCO family protein [Bauldia sp.]
MTRSGLRTLRGALWAAVAVVGASVVWFVAFDNGGENGIITADVGGPFTLIDQSGATVTEATLQGHPSALFFGYTFCPDVCPTTLSDLTVWLAALGAEADKLRVYFITVDPERDTQEQIASYLEAFDPRITGLTGKKEAVDQAIKAYRVYARKVAGEDGAYTMDHSASVYLLDSKANFVGTVDYQEDTDAVLAKLRRLIAAS